MKKNRMLRLASTLMILTLLTTSIIGGTFAKYTTTGSASDTARVAKWGVVINASGSLYSNAYAKDTNVPAAWTTGANTLANNISAATKDNTANDNIVAPGTESYDNGLSFSISGTPEVAVEVTTKITAEDIYLNAGTYGVLVKANVSEIESLKNVYAKYQDSLYNLNGSTYSKVTASPTSYSGEYYILKDRATVAANYFPVQYTLSGETKNDATDDPKTAVGIARKLAKAANGDTAPAETTEGSYKVSYKNMSDTQNTAITKTFPANTDLATAGPKFGNEKLTWAWPIDGNNPADTILGNLMADRAGDVDYVVVSVGTNDAVTALDISTTDGDYTVKNGETVVANLHTGFDISLEVTQVD